MKPSAVAGWARRSLSRAWSLAAHQRLRDALFALFIVGLLAYGAVFAWYMLTRFDLVNLLRDVSMDDAFHYFQIASHMAEGRFSTFDGGITRTNGYHPLWLFLITPFYWVFDKMEALFAIKAFEIMLVAGGVALVAVAARVARLPWILLLAVLPALYAQRGMLLGLEAALVLFMLGLLILATCLFARQPARWRWPLAALAFALPWARLEWAAVAVAVTGALCLLEWSGRFPDDHADRRAEGFPRRGRSALTRLWSVAPLAAAVAGLLAYLAYNGIVFGGIVPVSAATKMMWSQWNWGLGGGYSLVENFRTIAQLRSFGDELLVALEVAAYALLLWWLSDRLASRGGRGWDEAGEGRGGRGRGVLLLAFTVGVFGLAAGHLAKFLQSVLLVHPFFVYNAAHDAWYYVPAYLLEALVVPLRCFVAIYMLRWIGAARPRAANVVYFAGVAAAAGVLAAKADFAAPFRFVDAQRNSEAHDYRLHAYMGAAVMNSVLPPDALVGVWDSGIVGYFARSPVVNLDGLVNSYDYLRTRQRLARQAEAAGEFKFESFGKGVGSSRLVEQLGLAYVGNVFYGDERYDGATDRASFAFKTYETPEPHFEVLRRHFSLYCLRDGCSASFKERMASRLEPQADGTRLLASGRMAQAFATECAADDLAAWAWGPAEERALSAWTGNPDGSCSSFVMLPHGHRPPLRVRRVAYAEALAHLVGRQAPEIQAKFDVFQVGSQGGGRLLYARERCDWADVKTRFFLHLAPVGDDWDAGREPHGFNNADFMLEDHGSWSGAVGSPCLAEVPLPDYRVAAITTGQFTPAGRVWDGEIRLEPQVEAR